MTPELAEALTRKALEQHPELTFDSVLDAISNNEAIPFETEDAIALVKLLDYPSGEREVYGWLWACAPGRFRKAAAEIEPRVVSFARNNKADWIEVQTRPGAYRALKRFGYAMHATVNDDTVILRKRISHG